MFYTISAKGVRSNILVAEVGKSNVFRSHIKSSQQDDSSSQVKSSQLEGEGEDEGGCGYEDETRIGLSGVVASIHCDRDHKIVYLCNTVSVRTLIATSNIFIREIEHALSQASKHYFSFAIFLPTNNI